MNRNENLDNVGNKYGTPSVAPQGSSSTTSTQDQSRPADETARDGLARQSVMSQAQLTELHHGWDASGIAMAKCDMCSRAGRGVVYKCKQCKLSICKECCEGGKLKTDSRHDLDHTTVSWEPPAKPKRRQAGRARGANRRTAQTTRETSNDDLPISGSETHVPVSGGRGGRVEKPRDFVFVSGISARRNIIPSADRIRPMRTQEEFDALRAEISPTDPTQFRSQIAIAAPWPGHSTASSAPARASFVHSNSDHGNIQTAQRVATYNTNVLSGVHQKCPGMNQGVYNHPESSDRQYSYETRPPAPPQTRPCQSHHLTSGPASSGNPSQHSYIRTYPPAERYESAVSHGSCLPRPLAMGSPAFATPTLPPRSRSQLSNLPPQLHYDSDDNSEVEASKALESMANSRHGYIAGFRQTEPNSNQQPLLPSLHSMLGGVTPQPCTVNPTAKPNFNEPKLHERTQQAAVSQDRRVQDGHSTQALRTDELGQANDEEHLTASRSLDISSLAEYLVRQATARRKTSPSTAMDVCLREEINQVWAHWNSSSPVEAEFRRILAATYKAATIFRLEPRDNAARDWIRETQAELEAKGYDPVRLPVLEQSYNPQR